MTCKLIHGDCLEEMRKLADDGIKVDLVLDCFMGSGTTGAVANNLNRDFIGIELEEKYYNIAKKRCSEYQSKLG